jgi:erythromycin esterase-like protein
VPPATTRLIDLPTGLVVVSLAMVIAAGCAAAAPRAAAPRAAAGPRAAAPAPLDRLVRDVCDKRVVLLGEDSHHASGATLAVKAALVDRLVDECRFSAVLFEASLAEFVDLRRAFATGTATPAHVADAIGALWSTARESDPLVETLFGRGARRQVVLAGLDGQLGSTNLYAQTRLTDELVGYLAEPRRAACRTELNRYVGWRYDDVSPFDDAARARLGGCLTEVEAVIARRPRSEPADEAAAMARATRTAVEANGLPAPAAFDARDRAMYEAFRWHAARLPRDTKIIVWCATIHAAKTLSEIPTKSDLVPLGAHLHRALGDAAAAIGFSALTGSYGRPNKPAIPLDAAPAESLEARAFAGDGTPDLRYLGPAELAQRAPAAARAIDYNAFATAAWHEILDGMIVLREERPPVYVHDRTPRRARPPAN